MSNSKVITDSEVVKEFTEKTGNIIPEGPKLMSHSETFFLIKMMLDEIMELAATVEEPEMSKKMMIDMINESKNIPKETGTEVELIAAQADALVDCYYYSLNAAAKKGLNLSEVFKLVHEANMDKQIDGKFLKREDGKILKRPGWREPDVVGEIKKQIVQGGFNKSVNT